MSHSAIVLQAENLVYRYGGLLASDNVSLALRAGEIHAVIGPNGAGKSTLVKLLAGNMAPNSGRLLLDGENIVSLREHQRVRRGLARSFQITSVFSRMSVEENLLLAVQASHPHRFGLWRPRQTERSLFERAHSLARQCDIPSEVWGVAAGTLPHAAQRKLEFALALAPRPRVLLLDEPMAGMGPEDSRQVSAHIETLRGQVSILLIEHDMDAVFRLADRVSVLVYGRIIATGTPDEIRADALVQQAYLGDLE